jgi:hypothetical protein
MNHTAASHRTPADDLQLVIDHWQHLRALIDTSQSTDPSSRADYLRRLDQHDRDETALLFQHAQQLVTRIDEHGRVQYECARCDYVGEGRAHLPRPDRDGVMLGERPVPLRLHVVDACRAVEAALCELADQVAAEVQRDTVKPLRRPIPGDPVGFALATLAARDEHDPARWRYNLDKRSAVRAAEWLLARLRDEEGPCLPLRDHHRAAIGIVAREAARRVERTIGGTVDRIAVNMERPCPYCGHGLTLHAGGGEDDTVTCSGPGCTAPVGLIDGWRTWSTVEQLAALQRELDAAERRRKRAGARARQRAAARAQSAAA